MEQARWNRIEELLQAALDLDPNQRAAFLRSACGDDEDLCQEIQALLNRESEGQVLESPAIVGLHPHLAGLPLTGRQISHYHVEEQIGAGGMGEVYQARDDRLQRIVALKALPAEFTADPERVRRFEQEAFAASRLNHPNIVTIFETVQVDGSHFIVTERVEGQTLRELLTDPQTKTPRALSVEKALDIVIQIAAALKAAHTARIIHRDIKPENIMVRSDGVVKVLDFGIAKLSEESSGPRASRIPTDSSRLTLAGAVLGTASYMSPEQARGEPLDPRTDLYSLGRVLSEMVDRPPPELQATIQKLLRPDREDRHASAGELLDDLYHVKRRVESRTARRMVGWSGLAVVVALTLTGIGALLSVNEVWQERVLRDGHSAAARQAVFSPDGRLLVSCGEDGLVILWDFARREQLTTLDGQPTHRLAFSPDGRWLAAGGTDGSIVIWDARTWTRTRVLREHRAEIGALTFSPDAALLASSSSDPTGRAILWDTKRWEKIQEWPAGSRYGTFAFSPHLRQLVVSNPLVVRDLTHGSQYSIDRGANWIALSPDASLLVAVDYMGYISFYRSPERGNLSRVELVARHRAHHDHGRSVAFSPDGRLVASAAEDILLWDAATQQKIGRFEHDAIVWNVTFSPDGRWLVSTHGDGAVLIWNIAERQRAANLNEHSGAVRAVAFAPDGRRLASAGDDRSILFWDLDRKRKQAVLAAHRTRVAALTFNANQFGSADQDGEVIVWDLPKRQPQRRITKGFANYCLAISPNGRLIAASNVVYTFEGRKVLDFSSVGSFGSAYGAAFSADGRRLAFVTDDGSVLVFDAVKLRLLERQQVGSTPQVSLSISADGDWLVTGGDDGAVRLWSMRPLVEVTILGRHTARVKSVAFSPDGATIASAGDDKMIALWDVKRRKLRARIGTHASPIYSLAFSPDGRRLASGEHDRTVRVYTRQRSLWGFEWNESRHPTLQFSTPPFSPRGMPNDHTQNVKR